MAEAAKSTRTTTRTVTETEETFTLTLTPEEFAWLRGVVARQDSGAGEGASWRVWTAMDSPAEVEEESDRFTFKGVEYDLAADYRDPSGDLWRFTGARDANGEPLVSCLLEDADSYHDWPLSRLVETYSYGSGLRRA